MPAKSQAKAAAFSPAPLPRTPFKKDISGEIAGQKLLQFLALSVATLTQFPAHQITRKCKCHPAIAECTGPGVLELPSPGRCKNIFPTPHKNMENHENMHIHMGECALTISLLYVVAVASKCVRASVFLCPATHKMQQGEACQLRQDLCFWF